MYGITETDGILEVSDLSMNNGIPPNQCNFQNSLNLENMTQCNPSFDKIQETLGYDAVGVIPKLGYQKNAISKFSKNCHNAIRFLSQ